LDLEQKIEELRRILNGLPVSLTSKEMLDLSRKLDQLIITYQKRKVKD